MRWTASAANFLADIVEGDVSTPQWTQSQAAVLAKQKDHITCPAEYLVLFKLKFKLIRQSPRWTLSGLARVAYWLRAGMAACEEKPERKTPKRNCDN
jgi:hypothetical protein